MINSITQICKGDWLYLVIYDNSAGKKNRYTTTRVHMNGCRDPVIVGLELTFLQSLAVIEEDYNN